MLSTGNEGLNGVNSTGTVQVGAAWLPRSDCVHLGIIGETTPDVGRRPEAAKLQHVPLNFNGEVFGPDFQMVVSADSDLRIKGEVGGVKRCIIPVGRLSRCRALPDVRSRPHAQPLLAPYKAIPLQGDALTSSCDMIPLHEK